MPYLSRQSRPVIYRIFAIDGALSGGACAAADALAERLEVSRRTIERDIEQLRDFFGAPIAYDRKRRGYWYDRPFNLPRATLRQGELAVLLIGQRLLQELAGTPYAAQARALMEKLPLLLGEEVSVDLSSFDHDDFSFGLRRLRGDPGLVAGRFELLHGAIETGRTVRMVYRAAGSGKTTEREVEPYHLRMEDGAWYLIGHCRLRGEPRIFALDRMVSVERTEETFVWPESFSIQDYLGHSWSMERGTDRVVRAVFDAAQAVWVRERTWQEGQKLRELPDGGVELTVRASGLEGIKRWLLGFGRHARVIEPEELREMMKREVEEMVVNYE